MLYGKETSVVRGSGVKSNSIPPVTRLHRGEVSMDMKRSTILESDHPWYRGVKLYTSSGAEHNIKSYQRYLDCLGLENFNNKT